MRIGKYNLSTLCRLAPMAGISNTPFRLLCKELGSSLTTSEEISAGGLVHQHKRTNELAYYLASERPIAMQIVGAKGDQLAEAAKILEGHGADIIDLNMGCPVNKVVKTGAGAALMKDPVETAKILRQIRNAISIPLTIKIRGGWNATQVNAPIVARMAESEGVAAITVHPRTRSQAYSGFAPWEIIRQVVEAVKIPVTGNGDVRSCADAERMKEETGCSSVMIGRGALGKPWIFDPKFPELTAQEQYQYKTRVIRRHMDLIEEHLSEQFALIQMKKHLAWYTSGLQGGSKIRKGVFQFRDRNALWAHFKDYWEGLSLAPMFGDVGSSPNSTPTSVSESLSVVTSS